MGRGPDGVWSERWSSPDYEVDEHGRVVGAVNDRTPNNWGRWGDLDELGTVNFLTPEVIAEAAAAVRAGRAVGCALPLGPGGPVHPLRSGPVHLFSVSGTDVVAGASFGRWTGAQVTDDYLFLPLQGTTQWDGLAHFGYADTLYNGFWIGGVEAYSGARHCAIDRMKSRLVGRGVLLDLPRHLGLDRLLPGHRIIPKALDACARAQHVEVRSGDILLIRTGHVPWFYDLEDKAEFWRVGAPGLTMATVPWLHARQCAAVAMDNVAIEVEPFDEPFEHDYPVHGRLIRDLGLTLGELWWLEDLAEACAEEERWEFLVSAPPLNITGAAGSPVNPIAVL
ncbi:cyclase family protein [Streptomyces sp. NPDC000410]|uniref:cyclase family protein n=1 Tax=Streptomyces sp. NPDC000410 TaxID=3154254 RepID=UPI003326BC69